MKSHVAVVLGNGESRLDLEPYYYPESVNLIGCNAIHRDIIAVDHLVCCDRRMVIEALDNNYLYTEPPIYTRERYLGDFKNHKYGHRIRVVPDLPYQGPTKKDNPEHWGSGPYAVLLAATLGSKSIFMIGFDLFGNEGKINNVYKGSKNYLKAESPSVDPGYWIHQIKKIFQFNPDKKFFIVNRDDWKMPREWRFPNTEFVRLTKFSDRLDLELNIVYNNNTVD